MMAAAFLALLAAHFPEGGEISHFLKQQRWNFLFKDERRVGLT